MYRVACSRPLNGREWEEKALPTPFGLKLCAWLVPKILNGMVPLESQGLPNISSAKSPFLVTVHPVRERCILLGKFIWQDLRSFLVRQNPIRIWWNYLLDNFPVSFSFYQITILKLYLELLHQHSTNDKDTCTDQSVFKIAVVGNLFGQLLSWRHLVQSLTVLGLLAEMFCCCYYYYCYSE